MDFVADQVLDSWRLRSLTIVDNFSRECLAIVVDHHLKGENVLEAINIFIDVQAVSRKGFKLTSEFISKALDKWVNERNIVSLIQY